MPIVLKSGSLHLLEPSGPVQACNGIVLPLPLQSVKEDKNSEERNFYGLLVSDVAFPAFRTKLGDFSNLSWYCVVTGLSGREKVGPITAPHGAFRSTFNKLFSSELEPLLDGVQ